MNGCRAWINNTTGIYDPTKKIFRKNPQILNGVFDIVGFRKSDGKHIEVEIKTGRDKLSPDQLQHLDELKRGKCIFFIVKDFDDFYKQFKSSVII